MSYTLATPDLATEDLVHILGPYLGEKETTAMITTVQKLFNEGLEKGRNEGLEKGRNEGLEKGRNEGLEKGLEELLGEEGSGSP